MLSSHLLTRRVQPFVWSLCGKAIRVKLATALDQTNGPKLKHIYQSELSDCLDQTGKLPCSGLHLALGSSLEPAVGGVPAAAVSHLQKVTMA
jgi:hypothetical protein